MSYGKLLNFFANFNNYWSDQLGIFALPNIWQ